MESIKIVTRYSSFLTWPPDASEDVTLMVHSLIDRSSADRAPAPPTEIDTLPSWVPLLPAVIVIQDALLDAVHEQFVYTFTAPVPPGRSERRRGDSDFVPLERDATD